MENKSIVLARKPIEEKTITDNVLKYGTGGINIDGCRVSHNEPIRTMKAQEGGNKVYQQAGRREETTELKEEGRFPANFIIECTCDEVISGENNGLKKETFENYGNGEYGKKDGRKTQPTAKKIEGTWYKDTGDIHTNPDCPCRLLDEQSGEGKSVKRKKVSNTISKPNIDFGGGIKNIDNEYEDTGGASRFFYNIKNIDEDKINKQINEKGKIMETKNENVKLMLGNNIDKLKELPDNFVDSIVTDPPYGISFMNKKWDYDVPSVEFWKEVYRVLKPGGHILSFGGTRTYHRMVVNIEDAGFEIRDQIMWVYGSGFPKSLNIGKEVDKRGGKTIGWFGEWLVKWRKDNNIPQSKIAELFPSKTGGLTGCVSNWELGNNLPTNEQFNLICKTFNLPFNSLEEVEREFIGTKTSGIGKAFTKDGWGSGKDEVEITKGNSQYEGWGTGLKPANEPIVLARKPIEEKTITENVLRFGTGGINIDGCRIGNDLIPSPQHNTSNFKSVRTSGEYENTYNGNIIENNGRFPANFIIDEDASKILDEQSGEGKSTKRLNNQDYNKKSDNINIGGGNKNCEYNDTGGASRFFYVPKVGKKERNLGLDNFEDVEDKGSIGLRTIGGTPLYEKGSSELINTRITKNNHPTVKPINLLTYLVRLITPPNGIVMDCYMGSGSTGIAALLEGFQFIGMEMDEDYFKIAETRINNYELYKDLIKKK
jgi:DNA modification methylase